MAKKSEPKPTKTKKSKKSVKVEKAEKAEKGKTYYCEVCGCELVCAEESAGELMCCGQPMCVILG